VIVEDFQKLNSGNSPYIELFEIQINDTDFIYLTNYIKGTGDYVDESPNSSPPISNVLQFPDFEDNGIIREYYPVPCRLEGIEYKSQGQFPQPVLTIANVLRTTTGNNSLQSLIGTLSYQDLLGNKVRRRRTLQKYLYGEASYSNPPIEMPIDVYYLDRIQEENSSSVSFITVLPIDFSGILLPRRNIIGNVCPWRYTAAGEDLNEWEKVGGCTWRTDSQIEIAGNAYNIYVTQDDEYIISDSVSVTFWAGTASDQSYYSTVESGLEKIQSDGSLSSTVTFAAGDVNTGPDTITLTGHKFETGDMVTYGNGGGASIGNLTDGNYYYVNDASANTIYLYNTRANAIAGGGTGRVNLVSGGNGSAHTLSPSEFNYWQSATGQNTTPSDSSADWQRIRVYNTYTGSNEYTAVFTNDKYNTYFLYSSKVWKNIGRSQAYGLVNAPDFGSLWEHGDRCGKRLSSCGKRFKANALASISYTSGSGTLSPGDSVIGAIQGSRGRVSSVTGTTSGTVTFYYSSGDFEATEGLTSDVSPAWTATASGAISASGTQPSTKLDDSRVLPYGSFPTARIFQ